jgi:hypothetical protein
MSVTGHEVPGLPGQSMLESVAPFMNATPFTTSIRCDPRGLEHGRDYLQNLSRYAFLE